jgi:hypothetical protein
MRVILALVLLGVLVVPASVQVTVATAGSSDLDPQWLVLRANEVPARFRPVPGSTKITSNPTTTWEGRAYVARTGRVTGYIATYRRTARVGVTALLESRVDVFRRPEGARIMFRSRVAEFERSPSTYPVERTRAGLGAEGWVYDGSPKLVTKQVLWRHGRVVAQITTTNTSLESTRASARRQQRRIAALVGVALAAPGPVDPQRLVLRETDVPGTYRRDSPNTLLVPNAFESRNPTGRDRVERSGRVTGYRVTYIDPAKTQGFPRSIGSQAAVFRTEAGAQLWLAEYDQDRRRDAKTAPGASRTRVRLGAGGWLLASPGLVHVYWRYDRVFAMVTTTFVSRPRALALARVQQQRIAAAVR